jgi:hypothetical protein
MEVSPNKYQMFDSVINSDSESVEDSDVDDVNI